MRGFVSVQAHIQEEVDWALSSSLALQYAKVSLTFFPLFSIPENEYFLEHFSVHRVKDFPSSHTFPHMSFIIKIPD